MSDSCRVLLVDDSDELRDATRELLEEIGCAVTAAARGAEAIERFEAAASEGGFEVLVSDVFMPGLNGLELANALVARSPRLAVLLVSSRGGDPKLRRRLAAGDVAFVAKPFSLSELAAGLAEARAAAERRPADGSLARGRPAGRRPAGRRPAEAGAPRRRTGSARRGSGARPAWALAAAAVLVLGLGTAVRNLELGAPSLPAPGPDAQKRSAIVQPIVPIGPVSQMPAALAWQPVAGAGAYTVSLRAVDGTLLWQTGTDGPRAELPAAVAESLYRAVRYSWSVDALGPDGARLARSGPVDFEIELKP